MGGKDCPVVGLGASLVNVPKKSNFLRRLAGFISVLAVCGALGLLVVFGFLEGRKEAVVEAERGEPIKPPLRVALQAHGQPVVTIDAEAQEAINLQIVTPKAVPYQNQIRAFGTVLDLAELTKLNTDYVEAVSQLKTARAKLAASLPAYERAKALHKEKIGSLARLQLEEAVLIGDRAAVATAASKVRTLAATGVQEWGKIIGKGIVNSAPLIFQLIERQKFLLQVTVPPGVSVDAPAIASVEMGSGSRRIEAKYISPATRTDPKIQGRSFFYTISADSGVLPGMNVRVFFSSGVPVGGFVISPSAVVWWSGRAWVYVKLEGNAFTRREIPTDIPFGRDGGFLVPVRSLGEPYPSIVVKGAQMLLSEEFRAQIQVEGDDD